MSKDHLLVRAARGEEVERAPVWAMRQAGRWDPEFAAVRAGMGFYEFSADVERAAKASLCPRRFGVDGIILFYDITTLPMSMGLPFSLTPGVGPEPDRPIRTLKDLDRLNPDPDPSTYSAITELLRRVREELAGELPVIVFAGAPYTVATYCVGTGKDVTATRKFAAENPEVWDGLLNRLDGATSAFLNTLTGQGADLYQLFDSWAGLLTREEYTRWADRYHRSILAAATGVPRVLFVKENPHLDIACASGAEAISLGTQHDLAATQAAYPHLVFQGNLDEAVMRTGTAAEVAAATRKVVEAGGGRRHIVNLNHGVGKETPPANFAAYVKAARGE
jgi:uroporphyrinogen decarboxylase